MSMQSNLQLHSATDRPVFQNNISDHLLCPFHDCIFFPNSRALLPIFQTNSPDGSHFALLGSRFAQNTNPNPCSQPSHTLFGDICVHRTPLRQAQNTPFPRLNLKMGKLKCHLGNLDPNWAKLLKSEQTSCGPLDKGSWTEALSSALSASTHLRRIRPHMPWAWGLVILTWRAVDWAVGKGFEPYPDKDLAKVNECVAFKR